MARGVVNQFQICDRLGMARSQQKTISTDIREIKRLWRENITQDMDVHQERELAKLDELERTYWEGWERSRLTSIENRKQRKSIPVADSDGVATEDTETTTTQPDRDGNPAFLDGVLRCVTKRCQLLGLDEADMIERARKRFPESQPSVTINVLSLTLDDLQKMIVAGQVPPEAAFKRLTDDEMKDLYNRVIR